MIDKLDKLGDRRFGEDAKAFYKAISQYILRHRQAKNYSQEQLSFKCRLPRQQIYLFEQGRRYCNLYDFVKICQVLRVDFRFDGSFRIEPEEIKLVEAYRRFDYRAVMEIMLEHGM